MTELRESLPVDVFADIVEFHTKFDLLYGGKPRSLPDDLAKFRARFMDEELNEYLVATTILLAELKKASDYKDPSRITALLEDQLDALVDLVYVAVGTAYLHGFDFNRAWFRVHLANMAKVRALNESDSKRESTWDVVKPEGWTAPSHTDLVEDHSHQS